MLGRHPVALAIAAVCALGASTAAAQSSPSSGGATSVTAEALFTEGRRLVAEGNFEAACPKFEGAQKIAPTPGTLLNLASCYEKSGRLASAWASFREAISLSRTSGRNDLAESAQKRAVALEPRLSKLVITVTATAPNLEVSRDGASIPQPAWAVPVPVDPGDHVVEARAPGRKPLRVVAVAPPEGTTTTVNVPELEIDPSAKSPEPASSAAERPVPVAPIPPAPPDSDANAGSTQRALGIGVGALGVVGLVVGSVFAARASSKDSDSKAECRPENPNQCTAAGKGLRDDARSAGNAATFGVGIGVALVGTGVALFFTAPKSTSPIATVAVAPSLGGLRLQGTFR